MQNDIDEVLKRKFYVADCELLQFSVDKHKADEKLHAKGCAALVSGDIELEFNWIAQGSAASDGHFTFAVMLDELEPDFQLIGVSHFSTDRVSELCKKMLATCNWQTEVAECLPKNETDLASL